MNINKDTVGLYCIVRDAEKTIQALLNSVYDKNAAKPFFDEYVFVDTGSLDSTREIIARHFNVNNEWIEENANIVNINASDPRFRLILAKFKWVYDFSVARNYAFNLGSCEWRGYLDSDDVFEFGKYIKPTILDVTKRKPEVDAISIEYDYEPGITSQDVVRWVNWSKGFTWVHPIHEYLEKKSGSKFISKLAAMKVLHRPINDGPVKSLERNIKMCLAEHEKALENGNKKLAAQMSYYLATYYADDNNSYDLAIQHFKNCINEFEHTNFSSIAAFDGFKLIVNKDVDEAIEWASKIIKYSPDLPEGYYSLGIAYFLKGNYKRSADAFLIGMSIPYPTWNTRKDLHFMTGLAPAIGALSLAYNDKFEEALKIYEFVDSNKKSHSDIYKYDQEFRKLFMRKEGEELLTNFANYMIWASEPIKVKKLLDDIIPDNLRDTEAVYTIKETLSEKLSHYNNWEIYKGRYSEPSPSFDSDLANPGRVLELDRMQIILNWAVTNNLGKPLNVLSIGPWTAIAEEAILRINPSINLTVCEISPQGIARIRLLQKEFENRITLLEPVESGDYGVRMERDKEKYDLIIVDEVIEHIDYPNSLLHLSGVLKKDGKIFVSTPNAEYDVQPYKSEYRHNRAFDGWWVHVRAYNAYTLYKDLCCWDLNGQIYTTQFGRDLLAILNKDTSKRPSKKIDILAKDLDYAEKILPNILHILKSNDFLITIFAPISISRQSITLRIDNNVFYKELWQFNKKAYSHSTLFWRDNRKLLILDSNENINNFPELAQKNVFILQKDNEIADIEKLIEEQKI